MTTVGIEATRVAEAAGGSEAALQALNAQLERVSARARAEWAVEHLPGTHVVTSSFGAQAAVSLHLLTQVVADIPVVLIDTQYLFDETYRFVDDLSARLGLNLRTWRAERSRGWIEARHGKLWEKGAEGLAVYNEITKLEPFRRALTELRTGTWFSGLRRRQSATRRGIGVLQRLDGRFKVHPIVDWSDRDVGAYLRRHGLPYHPLWERGYVSIGDWTTTRSLAEAGDAAGTRFFGLHRECGMHGLAG
jgi:phosphoadenosine phosphosulfate reductase